MFETRYRNATQMSETLGQKMGIESMVGKRQHGTAPIPKDFFTSCFPFR